MAVNDISDLLGDTRETTDQSYLQKNRIDGTILLDTVEERIVALNERRLRDADSDITSEKIEVSSEVQELRLALRMSEARVMKLAENLAKEKAKNRKRRREKKRRGKELDLAV